MQALLERRHDPRSIVRSGLNWPQTLVPLGAQQSARGPFNGAVLALADHEVSEVHLMTMARSKRPAPFARKRIHCDVSEKSERAKTR